MPDATDSSPETRASSVSTADGGSSSAPPSISLPKGGGAIRGIGEKFAANPVTGTGSLSIPLATSPGRAGFSPSLALQYDSGAGNGPFGYGWQLSVPAITRKSDKGLPRYTEDPDDVFLLSGAEDLVPELDEHGSIRELDGREYQVRRYRPRIEGLFARIERWTDLDSGEVHWRSITSANIVNAYGRTAESRIADPTDPGRVFSWLLCESFDDTGNAIVYEYKPENSDGVDSERPHEYSRTETGRSANRYLKRVKYGNRVSRLTEPDLSRAEWMFEAVFDYGEHDRAEPGPLETSPWLCRQDPFSVHRSGFEVRTYRLCQRVLMFHHFPAEDGVGVDCLTRSTDLHYRSDPIASFVESVTQAGYRRRDTGGYLKKTMPPLEFGYTEAVIDERLRELGPESLENLPIGLDGPGYQWVDLDGEGISGVLTEQAGGWFYKGNLGEGRFGPMRQVANQPSMAALNAGRQQLVDLAGDGQLDLVDFGGSTPGFFERSTDEGWSPFRTFDSLPNLDWRDPNLRMVDLTGDGHADVLITEGDVFSWYPSLAEDGFGPALRTYPPTDSEHGPRLVFADAEQAIYLADMSGDGLTDLVRIRNGEVCYWPSLGYGRFGGKVAMDNAPWFDEPDQFDRRRVRVADIDGSGTTDLIYLHRCSVRIYRNQSGNALAPAHELPFSFPRIENVSQVSAVDLLGNGTACLVWSSPLPSEAGRQVRYVDLMGGEKPHLLVDVRNNLGAQTRVHYAPSTKFYLADKAAGRPWLTRLPFPVHVVERVEAVDRISGNRFASRYAYHHGRFDGVEREFCGFGMVEQWDTESFAALNKSELSKAEPNSAGQASNLDEISHVPPVLTKTWFHTGAFGESERISRQFEREYFREADHCAATSDELLLADTVFDDTVVEEAPLTPDERRQACRALKGSVLRQEVYAVDGSEAAARPYTVSERNYTIKLLQRAIGSRLPSAEPSHAVFFVYPRESIMAHYERRLYPIGEELRADPRVSHDLVLAVDDFGNVLRSVSVGYGRRHDDPDPALTPADQERQRRRHVVYTENGYTNAVDQPDVYRTPVLFETRAWEILGLSPEIARPGSTNPFGFGELSGKLTAITRELPYEHWDLAPTRPARRLIEHARRLYRSDDLSGPLPLGVLEAMALPFESYRLAFTPSLLTHLYGDRVDEEILAGPGGYVRHDGHDGWWIPSGRVFYSPDDGDPPAELEHAREHFFLPHRFRDQFGAITSVSYDRYDLLTQQLRDAVGNLITSGERDSDDRLVRNGNDYRVLQPWLVMDANRNRAQAAFDTLGMVAGTSVMGKPGEHLGDTLEGLDPDPDDELLAGYLSDPLAEPHRLLGGATTRLVYDLFAYFRTRNEDLPACPVVAALARETHVSDLTAGEQTKIQHSFSYSDGFGREIQQKVQAEPGPLAEGGEEISPRWVGTGWTIFNNKGKPVRQYEPFFSLTHRFEFAVIVGVSSVLFYDPVERAVATLHPNDTWEKVVFDPWHQASWDVNDTVLIDPREDTDTGGYVRRYLAGLGDWRSWYSQRIEGGLGLAEQVAAEKTAAHASTPGRICADSLGRTFLDVADNRSESYSTRIYPDIEGNEREVIDALGRSVMRYGYSMLGDRVAQSSMEAGERILLNDVAGKPIYSWNSRGFRIRSEYDELRRPVRAYVQGGDLPGEVLQESTEYGEGQLDDVHRNLRSHTFRLRDGAGVATSEAYDFRGNLLDARRQLAEEYKQVLDWTADVSLEEGGYTSHTRYDALNRPTELSTPDGSVARPVYNEANLLERLTANLRGADETTVFVTDIDYNARGQRESIEYGNGTRTRYSYDALTFRLTELKTSRDSTALQDLGYTYDPVGNITRIEDQAQQTTFFRNRRVDPNANYSYDAIYRLIEATGREHLGQAGGAPIPVSQDDAPRVRLAHPNDGDSLGRYVQRYVYDAAGNIMSLTHRGDNPAQPGWTRNYRYAELSLLEPDKVSNRLTGTTAGENETLQPFGYDEHGNITAMPELPLMRWDFRDQLRDSARQVMNDGRTPETTYYVYDSGGQRIRKVTERQGGVRKSERIYLGAFEVYREFGGDDAGDGAISLERETLHVLDDKQRIAMVETRTVGEDEGPELLIRFQLTNHLGSAGLELDATAEIISYEEYYPYGSTSYQAVRSQTETPKRYRYTGKERDAESGLSYHGARYYAPWLGRWTSCDPAGLVDGPNLYGYARANPLRLVDASGLEGDEPEQLWFSQSPPYRQPVTATATGRGINDLDRANLRKAAQMWGGPAGEIEAGHMFRPFVLIKAGETELVYAQDASGNASQGASVDRAAGVRARVAGLFARVRGRDLTATVGTVYGHPPLAEGFQSPAFQQWQVPSGGPGIQLNLPFGEGVLTAQTPPRVASPQLELPFGTGLPARPPSAPSTAGPLPASRPQPQQLNLPFSPAPSSSVSSAASTSSGAARMSTGINATGNVLGGLTRAVVPGVIEAEIALTAGSAYAYSAAATATGTTATALTATGGALATGAAAVPVVGIGVVAGGLAGNVGEQLATNAGASTEVAQASGALSAVLVGAGAGALVGAPVGGIGAVPGAIVGAAAGLVGYAISKFW